MKRKLFNLLSVVVVLTMLVPAGVVAAPARVQPAAETAAPVVSPLPQMVSAEEAWQKIHPQLRKLAEAAAPALPGGVSSQAADPQVRIMVTAKPGTDLSAYMTDIIPTRELFEGEQDFYGSTTANRLFKIASLADVMFIIPVTDEKDGPSPIPPEDQPATPAPNAAKLSKDALPWDQAKASGDGRDQPFGPQDWFEVMPQGPHKAETAWARGFDGTGVTTEVNDDGVDWAHPDLMGRQKIYSTTTFYGSIANCGSQGCCGPKGCMVAYNGWPMAFSPLSLRQYVDDSTIGSHYIANGQPSNHYADTSATPALRDCGVGLKCFDYTPLIDYATRGAQHTYIISATMSKSGIVHVGTHPDENLRDYVWHEKVSVLVTDPITPGVYSTVYVDLNDDYDFRDEKPLTKADTTNAATLEATKNNMIAYRDMNGDGKADLSGGALYFIADGVTPLPMAWFFYYAWAAPPPGNGNLVAFDGPWATGESHGTLCASNVVGQGQANAMLPAFKDAMPTGAVFGAAKNARLVDVSNIYYDFANSKLRAYTFAIYGYDGQRSTNSHGPINANDTDGTPMASNSYGSSNADNDGWDYDGRYVSRRVRLYGKYLANLDSTGNGAPAYGTTTPPSGDVSISVGASTQYGSTGWDSITSTTQIMSNDVAWYSNRGPSARGNNGVDVLADGQRGAGDLNLNYSVGTWGMNGNNAWVTWGGTSRSAPAAMGNLALIYQAFKAKYGRWPWWDEAKALFKSTSTDLNYDVLTQGSGSVNSDRGTLVAGGWYGLLVTPDEWNPGAYRGADYPAFAHVMTPTQTAAKTFTVNNTGITTITASVVNGNPTLISSKTFTYTVTPAQVAALSPDTFQVPQIIIPITATASKIISNSWWSHLAIPSDAQLMLITMRLPYGQFDVDDDYNWDNRWRLTAYNWKDVNGNAKVWDDKNSNNVVNYSLSSDITIDGFVQPHWSDAANEIDRWEYGRFDYARPGGNVYQLPIHDPLARMQDGLFLGLNRYAASTVQQTDLTFRVDFYKYQPVSWLSTSASSLQVAPGAAATFIVTATTNNTAAGIYEAAIKITDPGGTVSGVVPGPNGTVVLPSTSFPAHTTVVPVAMAVAPDYSEGMMFGGAAQAAAEASQLYNNAVVRGYQDWTWRAESGDWRFFFFDNPTTPASGTKLIVKDEWGDAGPHTDIDTILMGPTLDAFSPGGSMAAPTYYGPYTLDTVGKSPNTNTSAGIWRFNTSTGGPEDWVTAPFQEGLHLAAQHNVLFEGSKFDVVFTKTVGTVRALPDAIDLYTYADTGSEQVVVQSGLALPGMVANAYGLGGPERYSWLVPFTGPGSIEFTYSFGVEHAAKIDIASSRPDISDIDIFLYRWTGTTWTLLASSAGATSDEHILVTSPADGTYLLGIDNYSGPAGTVDAVFTIVQGTDLAVSGTTTNTVAANTPVTLTVAYSKTMNPGDVYQGTILLGPTKAPSALEIPVTIHRLSTGGTIAKKANSQIANSGDLITYTIQVQNTSQPTATFTVVDAVPANTTFVTATDGTVALPAVGNVVTWTGQIPGSVTYEWRDSDSNASGAATLGQVAYAWEEIRPSGTLLPVVNGGNAEVTLPFNFKFDGQDYTSLYVNDDGLIAFASTYLTGTAVGNNYVLPCATCDPATFLAVFPSDVNLSPNSRPGTTGVWYKVLGGVPNRRVVVEWVLDWGGSSIDSYAIFQAILYEGTNRIKFQYNDVAFAIANAPWPTVGLQQDAVRAVDYTAPGYPAPGHLIKNYLAILFNPIYPSVTLNMVTRANTGVAANTRITNTAALKIDHVLAQAGQVENFSSSAYVTANPSANLSTSTLFGTPWVYPPGGTIEYVLDLINTGPVATMAALTATIPPSTTFRGGSLQGFYNPATNLVTWQGMVGGNGRVELSLFVAVDPAKVWTTGPITGTALVTCDGMSQPLSAVTQLLPRYKINLPLVLK